MADGKYNLDNIISKAIHRPAIKSRPELPPLYARVGNESESTIDANALKDPVWIAKAQESFNSPTNVRRLFIGDRKVYIQYYVPYIMNGKSADKLWAEYSYEQGNSLEDMVNDAESYKQRQQEALANRTKMPPKLSITKTGLGGISAHWKMSNIEEVYVTPSIVYSEDVQRIIGPGLAQQVLGLVRQSPVGKLGKLTNVLTIFEAANGGNIKNIRSRFPRLRTVAFMTNIDATMQQTGAKIESRLPSQLSDLTVKWYKYAQEKGFINNSCTVAFADVPFDKEDTGLEFIARPAIYKFDAIYLEAYFNKYKEKGLSLARSARDKALGRAEEQDTSKREVVSKSTFEQMLDKSYESDGLAVVSATLQLTFSTNTKEEIDKVFASFTKEGRDRYRKLLGR